MFAPPCVPSCVRLRRSVGFPHGGHHQVHLASTARATTCCRVCSEHASCNYGTRAWLDAENMTETSKPTSTVSETRRNFRRNEVRPRKRRGTRELFLGTDDQHDFRKTQMGSSSSYSPWSLSSVYSSPFPCSPFPSRPPPPSPLLYVPHPKVSRRKNVESCGYIAKFLNHHHTHTPTDTRKIPEA